MVFGKLSLSLLHTPALGLATGMGSSASTHHSVCPYLPYEAALRALELYEWSGEKRRMLGNQD